MFTSGRCERCVYSNIGPQRIIIFSLLFSILTWCLCLNEYVRMSIIVTKMMKTLFHSVHIDQWLLYVPNILATRIAICQHRKITHQM